MRRTTHGRVVECAGPDTRDGAGIDRVAFYRAPRPLELDLTRGRIVAIHVAVRACDDTTPVEVMAFMIAICAAEGAGADHVVCLRHATIPAGERAIGNVVAKLIASMLAHASTVNDVMDSEVAARVVAFQKTVSGVSAFARPSGLTPGIVAPAKSREPQSQARVSQAPAGWSTRA